MDVEEDDYEYMQPAGDDERKGPQANEQNHEVNEQIDEEDDDKEDPSRTQDDCTREDDAAEKEGQVAAGKPSRSPYGPAIAREKQTSREYEQYLPITTFFEDKIVKDVACGRGLIVVVAEPRPRMEPPEKLNFLELEDSVQEETLEVEEPASPVSPTPVRDPTPEPSVHEEPEVIEEPPPVEEKKVEPPPPIPLVVSPPTQRVSRVRELIERKRREPRLPPPRPKILIQQTPEKIETPEKPPSPIIIEKDDHEERKRRMEEERAKAAEARQKKRLLREERQREADEQKKMMELEMRQTIQSKR